MDQLWLKLWLGAWRHQWRHQAFTRCNCKVEIDCKSWIQLRKKKQEKKTHSIFVLEWPVHQEKDSHFVQASVEDLAANPRAFYACSRSADGNVYSESSLTNQRAGINRFLTSSPYSRQINLVQELHISLPINCLLGWSENCSRMGWIRNAARTPSALQICRNYINIELWALITLLEFRGKCTMKRVCISAAVGKRVLGSFERLNLSSIVMR